MNGKELKILRKKAGLTQTQLAEKIGTHKQVISGWENNKHIISSAYLKVLATVLS